MTAELLQSAADGVLTLTLNRPDVLNAITPPLLDELTAALQQAAAGRTVRAVIITGAGRGFCSGQDLRAAAGDSGLDVGAILRDHYAPAIRVIRSMDQPVIAAVNGVAAGAGFSLALACDLRIAADSATFVQAFVRIGLIPDLASTYFLPRLVGPARAAELTMLGETVDSSRALQLGIVNRVVPDAELGDVSHELAARLARGPRSIALTKHALDVSGQNDLEAQLAVEERLQTEATTTSDFLEGISAFLEKRPATFTGV
ncbi:MAG TPA: enoyl-CoA hydratase-related protein [Candidatus Saccharimonadales bacterium]|nr:enoyl-CoA hydratase-related protein [Candidatus Saccharimonadales bacterium]